MRVVILQHSHRDPLLESLKRLLQSKYGVNDPLVADGEQLELHITQQNPDLVIVCLCSAMPEKTLDVLRRLRCLPATHAIVVGQANDLKLVLRLMQAGADLFVDEKDLEGEFDASLMRLRIKTDASGSDARVISILSASGGCGASTLAVNAATIIAQDKGKCGLIDLNPGRGDLTCLLDLKPQYTLTDVCMNETRLDRAMFETMLARHDTGIHLLAAAPHLDDIRPMTMGGVEQAVVLCKELMGCVVVDHQNCLHEVQVAVLQRATSILLVCRLALTCLRHTKRIVEHLRKLGIVASKVKIVVNQFGQPGELPVDEAEHALGEKLTYLIPYDPKAVNVANNAGMPLVANNGSCKFTQSIAALVRPKSKASTNGSHGLVLLPGLRLLRKAMGAAD